MQLRRKALAAIMRRFLECEGKLSFEDMADLRVSSGWKKELARQNGEASDDKLFNDAYHLLMHFISELDVRRENPAYALKQIEDMNRYMQQLEAD